MAGQYGVKETLEVLELGFAVGAAGKAALADGKVTFNDMGHIFPVFPKVDPAIQGIALVPKELGELDEEESKQVLDFVKGKLPTVVDDEQIRFIAGKVFKAGLAVAEVVAVL